MKAADGVAMKKSVVMAWCPGCFCRMQAHAALVVAVRDVQALVLAAFDAPGRPVELKPLGGVQFGGRQARHQRDRLGGGSAGTAFAADAAAIARAVKMGDGPGLPQRPYLLMTASSRRTA